MSANSKRDKEKTQAIQVCVRIRPLNKQEREDRCYSCIEVANSRELLVKQQHPKKYAFDSVFGPTTKQLTIYESVVQPLITEVLAGYNCTTFAYGQTGTGKTYTMAGGCASLPNDEHLSWQDDEHAGIIPRALAHLFDELRLTQQEHTVRVSYIELYNEELYDLLSDGDDTNRIRLYEDHNKKGSVIIQGVEEQTVTNKYEVYKILEKGQEKRRTASTLMNAQSSRSHTVFSITVHTRETSVDGEVLVKTGKLNLVDLAGSENISRSGAVDRRAREAGNINQSLLNLGRVIKALVEKSAHVPYRASKLTRILQDSLGGRTKTSIIATISPAISSLDETLNTLEYAYRARNITNRPEVNQRMSQKALLTQYVDEIERLRKDLSASRTGNGVYLAPENYNRLIADQRMCTEELAEKVTLIRELEKQVQQVQSLFQQNVKTLDDTKIKLEVTEKEKKEQEHLAGRYAKRAETLHGQAQTLLEMTKSSTLNESVLREKVEKLYACALTNNNSIKKVSAEVEKTCDKVNDELHQFMSEYYKRNNGLIEVVNNLQKVQEEKFQKTKELTADMTMHMNTALGKLQKSINNQKEVTLVHEIVNLCHGFVEIVHDIHKWSDTKPHEYFKQILNIENERHESLTKNMEQKLNGLSNKVDTEIQDNTIFLETAKEEILFGLLKLKDDLSTEISTSDHKLVEAQKWLEEMQKSAMLGFKFMKQQICNEQKTHLRSLNHLEDSKNLIETRISEYNQNMLKSAEIIQVGITDITDTIVESKIEREKSHLEDQILNGYHVEAKAKEKVTEESVNTVLEKINSASKNVIENKLKILSQLTVAENELIQTTSLEEICGKNINELNKEFKTHSDNMVKNLSVYNETGVKHESSVSAKLHSCKEIITSLTEKEIIEIKHAGDTPVRQQYTIPSALTQLTPKENILMKFRQQQQLMLEGIENSPRLSTITEIPGCNSHIEETSVALTFSGT